MRSSEVASILSEARSILAEPKRQYQTRFIAALDMHMMEEYHDPLGAKRQRPKWQSCSPLRPEAMLSLRGAIIAACGGGPPAWEVFEAIGRLAVNIRTYEPGTKEEALALLDNCIGLLGRRYAVRPVTREAELV